VQSFSHAEGSLEPPSFLGDGLTNLTLTPELRTLLIATSYRGCYLPFLSQLQQSTNSTPNFNIVRSRRGMESLTNLWPATILGEDAKLCWYSSIYSAAPTSSSTSSTRIKHQRHQRYSSWRRPSKHLLRHQRSMRLLPLSARTYATLPSQIRPNSRLPKQPLSLDHFLLRQRALALYRQIIRSCHKLQDPTTTREMKMYAREEFERQREVVDLRKIRYLLSTGKTEFERLGKQVSRGGGPF